MNKYRETLSDLVHQREELVKSYTELHEKLREVERRMTKEIIKNPEFVERFIIVNHEELKKCV